MRRGVREKLVCAMEYETMKNIKENGNMLCSCSIWSILVLCNITYDAMLCYVMLLHVKTRFITLRYSLNLPFITLRYAVWYFFRVVLCYLLLRLVLRTFFLISGRPARQRPNVSHHRPPQSHARVFLLLRIGTWEHRPMRQKMSAFKYCI